MTLKETVGVGTKDSIPERERELVLFLVCFLLSGETINRSYNPPLIRQSARYSWRQ